MTRIEVFIAFFNGQSFRYKKYKKRSLFYYGNHLKT